MGKLLRSLDDAIIGIGKKSAEAKWPVRQCLCDAFELRLVVTACFRKPAPALCSVAQATHDPEQFAEASKVKVCKMAHGRRTRGLTCVAVDQVAHDGHQVAKRRRGG